MLVVIMRKFGHIWNSVIPESQTDYSHVALIPMYIITDSERILLAEALFTIHGHN